MSPFVHRYPQWIAHDLAELIDGSLSRAWFDDTGIFDGSAIRRAWEGIRSSPRPHPQTAYLLIWLCSLRCLAEELPLRYRDDGSESVWHARAMPRPAVPTRRRPPWGFAGRDPDSMWRRLGSKPRQLVNALRCKVPRRRVIQPATEAAEALGARARAE